MTLRIVNLGLPKTGTTTLARALRRAGLHVADHRIRPRQSKDKSLHDAYVGDLLYKGFFETGNPAYFLEPFDAITEMSVLREDMSIWPQMDFAIIDALRRHNPKIKFLGSNRDHFALSQSMLAWSNLGTERLPNGVIPGLPQGYGSTTKEREQWIQGHYAHLRAIFHHDETFLEYDIADSDVRRRLEGFLGIPLPWWGRANTNPLNRKSRKAPS
ncbi:MAG: sulfotransferase [Paracoccaceae bacterium]